MQVEYSAAQRTKPCSQDAATTAIPTELLVRYQQLQMIPMEVLTLIQIIRLSDDNYELSTTMPELARYVGLSARSMRRTVKRLVDLGLIIRETPAWKGTDGVYVVLTPMFDLLDSLSSTDPVLTETPGSQTLLRRVTQRYGNSCLNCGSESQLTADHVIPRAHGGRDTLENLQPLCMGCNLRKGTQTIDYRVATVSRTR